MTPLQNAKISRPFGCLSPALLELIERQVVQHIALNWIERLVDWLMTCFSSTYTRIYNAELAKRVSVPTKPQPVTQKTVSAATPVLKAAEPTVRAQSRKPVPRLTFGPPNTAAFPSPEPSPPRLTTRTEGRLTLRCPSIQWHEVPPTEPVTESSCAKLSDSTEVGLSTTASSEPETANVSAMPVDFPLEPQTAHSSVAPHIPELDLSRVASTSPRSPAASKPPEELKPWVPEKLESHWLSNLFPDGTPSSPQLVVAPAPLSQTNTLSPASGPLSNTSGDAPVSPLSSPESASAPLEPSPKTAPTPLESRITEVQQRITQKIKSSKPTHATTKEERLKGTLEGLVIGDRLGLLTRDLTSKMAHTLLRAKELSFSLRVEEEHQQQFKQLSNAKERDNYAGSWTENGDMALVLLRAHVLKNQHAGYQHKSISQIVTEQLEAWTRNGLSVDQPHGFKGHSLPACRRMDPMMFQFVHSTQLDPKSAQFVDADQVWKATSNTFEERLASNGSLTRASIIGALHYNDLQTVVSKTIMLTRITHPDPRAIAASVAVALANAILIQGHMNVMDVIQEATAIAVQVLKDEMGRSAPEELSRLDHYEIEFRRYASSLANAQVDFLQSSNDHCYGCMLLAFYALRKTMLLIKQHPADLGFAYYQIMKEVLMYGGDASANGATVGALLGSLFGRSNIHFNWIREIDGLDRQVLTEAQEQLLSLAIPRQET